ncbi:hypothetical protein [Caulobacter sp. 17J80-11]|uniref:hypothetical protein n=1 Tax=Caulobacter sp. 17J80-11 TaxID=2763502 RepID=UPI001653845A|nr:hypothetical protein [Caulobacter sp. 17J80-11]MBC6981347.1 hypothetical protein [Caulobacter sp. 17J80-11]
MRTVAVAFAGLALLAACGKPSEKPGNPAVDTSPTSDTGTAAGANSFTEDQARGAIEKAGYTDVTELVQNDQGVWAGKAMKNGKSVPVSVDYRGSVVESTGAPTADLGAGGPTPPGQGASPPAGAPVEPAKK